MIGGRTVLALSVALACGAAACNEAGGSAGRESDPVTTLDATGGADAMPDVGDSADVPSSDAAEPDPDAAPEDDAWVPPAGAPTWYGDIEAVVLEHCGSCHLDGGIGPFPLIDYPSASTFAASSLDAMRSGRMPPWPPDTGCNRYEHERRVAPAAIDRFEAWVDAGTPMGDPALSLPVPDPPAMPVPDLVARPTGPYTPSATKPDDYRCFVLDAEFAGETYATDLWVEPGVQALVHHVLVYRIDPERVAEMEARDGEDGAPGFECFGGAAGGPIGWYVPGTTPRRYEGGDALVIPAGSRLLMQVHYNTLTSDPEPDETTLRLVLTEAAPESTFHTIGFANGRIRIPAGDEASTHVAEQENTTPFPLVIREVAGHMHLLGTRIALEAVRSDGSTECLLDIPGWDFDWQQFYTLRDDVVLQPGESLRMTCTYDDSAANQPIVNGERLSPRTVTWGEGTLDEMCLTYVTVVQPLNEILQGVCRDFDVCRAGCEDPESYLCLMDCSVGVSACGDCVVDGFFGEGGCVRNLCGLQASRVVGCYGDCRVAASTTGANLVDCMREQCADGLAAVDACVTPHLAVGTCDDAITACTDL